MNEFQYIRREEFNDLYSTEIIIMQKKDDYQKEKTRNEISTTSTGSSIGIVTGIIPSLISIILVVVIASSFVLKVPIISTDNWVITYNQIEFVLRTEVMDDPYSVTLQDIEHQEFIREFYINDIISIVSFEGLTPEQTYEVTIKVDYGIGQKILKSYHIMTAGVPLYPRGILKVESHNIDYQNQNVIIVLDIIDPGHYLTNYKIVMSDDINSKTVEILDMENPIIISLDGFSRGFVQLELYVLSSYPMDSNIWIKTASYMFYY